MVKMAEKIGKREGLGQLLGEGVRIRPRKSGKTPWNFPCMSRGSNRRPTIRGGSSARPCPHGTAARVGCHNASWSHPYEMGLSMPEIGIMEPQDPYRIEGKAGMTAKLPGPHVRHGFADPLPVRPGRQGGQRRQTCPWLHLITGREWGCPGVHAGRGTGLQPQEALQHTPGDQPQGRFLCPPVSDPQQERPTTSPTTAPHGPSPCRLLRGSRVDRGRHPLGGKAQIHGDTRVMRSSLFLFDFDGVLVDSLDLYAEALQRCLERIGTPIVKNREEYLDLFDREFLRIDGGEGGRSCCFRGGRPGDNASDRL